MDRASGALVATRYFECERLCLRAMGLARKRGDYGRMARICMPLQEARRQKRQLAIDAGGVVSIARRAALTRAAARPVAGVYILRPPLAPADARSLRAAADRRGVPALVVFCGAPTASGSWPIAAVGGAKPGARARRTWPVSLRAEVPAPRDGVPGPEWLMAATERLGDEAIRSLDPGDAPAQRVERLLLFLDAHPDHEKLHQRLEEACRGALEIG